MNLFLQGKFQYKDTDFNWQYEFIFFMNNALTSLHTIYKEK